MRITENRMLRMMSDLSMRTQTKIADASRKVSTGLDVEQPSHDPTRWAEGMRTQLALGRREDHESGVVRSRSALDQVDGALQTIANSLSTAKELATMAGTETFDATARTAAAIEVAGAFADMVAAANVRSVGGEYLLAGTATGTPAFDDTGAYQGNAEQRSVEVGDGTTKLATVPGSLLTAAAGIDVMGAVSSLQAALEANDPVAVRAASEDISTAIEQVGFALGEVGAASAALNTSASALDDLEVMLTESLENTIAVDPIEAATQLAGFSNDLEASRLVSERLVALTSLGR